MTTRLTERLYSANAAATQALGRSLGQLAQSGDFLACNGPLGAGKTTLIQGFAEGLGVGQDYYVRSPTFTLMQEYHGRLPLYHFDFYRLSHDDAVWDIGFEDYLEAGGVMMIEWADKFPAILPAARLDLRIAITAAEQRRIEWTATHHSHAHYLVNVKN
jgi:tRNA threonylcarbamoyladenosine biosynthesis protein TsaE